LVSPPQPVVRTERHAGRLLAILAVAASMLIGTFYFGRITSNRRDLASVSQTDRPVNPSPIEDRTPTTGLASSEQPTLMAFVPRVSLQAIRRPGSVDPMDVIVFGPGPRNSIALGQGDPFEQPQIPGAYIHIFDPRISPRSRVLTQNEVKGVFVVSPDGKLIVTQSGLQIVVETEQATQLPGDWSQVSKVQFCGLDRLLITRAGLGSRSVEVLTFPKLERVREITDTDLDSSFTADNLGKSGLKDHEIWLLQQDGEIRIFDSMNDTQLVLLKSTHSGSARTVAISTNRQLLAIATNSAELLLHDLAAGKLKYRLSSGSELASLREARTMAFSPDNRLLAVAEIQRVVVYDVESGRVVEGFPNSSGGGDQILWGSNSRDLTVIHGSYIQRYQDGHEVSVYPFISHWSLVFDPDEK